MAFKHVLITGASSGIGAALAQRFARAGTRLSLTGRNPTRLQQISDLCRKAGAETDCHAADIADSDSIGRWIRDCDAFLPVDLVIANAGIGGSAVIVPPTGEEAGIAHEIIATNILGVANTVIPLLPRFVERGAGHVVIMSSMAAYFGLPQSPLYSASKAAVRVYGQALRRLVAPRGVCVTIVCPGFVETPMSASIPGTRPMLWSVDRAAERILRGIQRGEREISFPFAFAAAARLANMVPAGLVDYLFARIRPASKE
ncbi:MAG TPA: SDR family NAD(P)-dependent oxidoreductase [Rhizomicrobium sp.]|jgi:short-subunit dehydrogenase